MQQVLAGSQDAAWTLVEEYGPYVLRAVRRHLPRTLRSKYDSQDFVQAVWKSFFAAKHNLENIQAPQQLIGFLAASARNRIVDEYRKRTQTKKYDVKRERSLEGRKDTPTHDLPSSDPTPSAIAMCREEWELFMNRQPARYRVIVQLRFMGKTQEEIAGNLNISDRTVRRVLKRVFQKMG